MAKYELQCQVANDELQCQVVNDELQCQVANDELQCQVANDELTYSSLCSIFCQRALARETALWGSSGGLLPLFLTWCLGGGVCARVCVCMYVRVCYKS